MVRTSFTQFVVLVDFMERNGDLSKPSGGPRGRQFCINKWKEVTVLLNSEGTGDSRSEEKWRKVWSDLKNNTKRKWARINRSMQGTGGGPAINIALTDLEQRVMAIIGVQAATGMGVAELGFGQTQESVAVVELQATAASAEQSESEQLTGTLSWPLLDEDSENTPGTSSGATRMPPSQPLPPQRPSTPVARSPSPLTPTTSPAATNTPLTRNHTATPVPEPSTARRSRKRRRNQTPAEQLFLRCETNARESERERDRMFVELERERIRQRDIELQLQAQWLEFMKDAMNVLGRLLDRN